MDYQRDIRWIVIDTTKTPAEQYVDAQSEQLRALRRGCRKIAYHFVVRRDGTVDTGRALSESAFCVPGYNAESVAIALAGTDEFTRAQETALMHLVQRLCVQFPRASIFDLREGPEPLER